MAQIILASIALALLGLLALVKPKMAIVFTLIFLIFLGFIRRLVGFYFGPVELDPLLLVGPIIAILLILLPHREKNKVDYTSLTVLIAILIIIMLIQIFNPNQGNLLVGLSGALFMLIPLAWFWIGRNYNSVEFTEKFLYKVVFPIGVIVALYGLWQTFFGFSRSELSWINSSFYNALSVGGIVRPFSFFVSASEYAAFLVLTSLLALFGFIYKTHRGIIIFIPIILSALFLISVRGAIVVLAFSLAIIWALKKSTLPTIARLVIAILFLGLSIIFGATYIGKFDFAPNINPLVNHQVSGLLNPLEQESSTAKIHFDLMVSGFRSSVENPLGFGLGSINLGSKMDDRETKGTEIDFSDTFISLGIFGGLLYLIIIVKVFFNAYHLWRQQNDLAVLLLLGIILAGLGGWLSGGQYFISSLIWFSIGLIDQLIAKAKTPEALEK